MFKSNSNSYKILVGICSVVVTAAIGYLIVWAGNLNPPGTPADTMYTLDDIYHRLDKDAGAPASWGLDPSASPASTMHTLEDVYNITPDFRTNPGDASTSDVFINKTFYKDSATKLTGTLERAGYSTGSIESSYANGEEDRFVVDQSGASENGITSADDIATGKYAWSNGTWYGPGTLSAGGGGGLPHTGFNDSNCCNASACGQTCPLANFPNQDGDNYQALNYTDNGDGTVTDNITGLVWEKDGSTSGKTWQQALQHCNSNSDGLPGTGWRLPNTKELQSIVNYSRFNPSIDQPPFSNTGSDYYWSGTSYANYPGYAWGVSFAMGYVFSHNKAYTFYVRCVRGQ